MTPKASNKIIKDYFNNNFKLIISVTKIKVIGTKIWFKELHHMEKESNYCIELKQLFKNIKKHQKKKAKKNVFLTIYKEDIIFYSDINLNKVLPYKMLNFIPDSLLSS